MKNKFNNKVADYIEEVIEYVVGSDNVYEDNFNIINNKIMKELTINKNKIQNILSQETRIYDKKMCEYCDRLLEDFAKYILVTEYMQRENK